MNADYFIKKFKSIPDKRWTTGIRKNQYGQCCALGHCTREGESSALINLFVSAHLCIVSVNDNWESNFLTSMTTPKGRILEALEYIKANEAKL